MSGRRSHARFAVIPAAEARFRLLRDIVVQGIERGNITAISREPGIVGETVTVEMPRHRATELLAIQVVDSRPFLTEGNLRHQLKLRPLGDASRSTPLAAAESVER
jgi:hypothetical protein